MPSPGSHRLTLEDFPTPGPKTWNAEAERLLKGASFEKVLRTRLPEGIVLEPIYHRRDVEDLPLLQPVPGLAPFLRGLVTWRRPAWRIAQEQDALSIAEVTEELEKGMSAGLQVIHLVLDEAFRSGTQPSSPPTGEDGNGKSSRGLPLQTAAELDALLGEASLVSTPLFLQSGAKSLEALALLVAIARRRGVETKDLQGAIGADPLGEWARKGQLSPSLEAAFDELGAAILWTDSYAPELGVLWCHGELWHDAGANAAQELGMTLAAVADSLRALEQRGVDPQVAAHHLRWSFAAGSTFFTEVAKLRAARVLLHSLLSACGAGDETPHVDMHVRTSRRNKSTLDPHTNLLRATTEAFSAAVGGADSIHVDTFSRLNTASDPFARRLARSLQIILREEARLGAVLDPAGGSWYVERLSWELATKAWEVFQVVEAAGGLRQSLRKGKVQSQLAASARSLRSETARAKNVRVGVNKYPAPPKEGTAAGKALSTGKNSSREKERPATAAKNADATTAMENADATTAMENATPAIAAPEAGASPSLPLKLEAGMKPLPLAKAVIDLALAGASATGMSAALAGRASSSPGETIDRLQPFRETLPFENLRDAVEEARARGLALDVMIVPLGPVASFLPRLDFTRAFFQSGGFDPALAAAADTPEEVSEEAARQGAFAYILCGKDDSYREMGEKAARALKKKNPDSVIVLAGSIRDKELHARLREAGVEFFVHLGSDRIEILQELARQKGVVQ